MRRAAGGENLLSTDEKSPALTYPNTAQRKWEGNEAHFWPNAAVLMIGAQDSLTFSLKPLMDMIQSAFRGESMTKAAR